MLFLHFSGILCIIKIILKRLVSQRIEYIYCTTNIQQTHSISLFDRKEHTLKLKKQINWCYCPSQEQSTQKERLSAHMHLCIVLVSFMLCSRLPRVHRNKGPQIYNGAIQARVCVIFLSDLFVNFFLYLNQYNVIIHFILNYFSLSEKNFIF